MTQYQRRFIAILQIILLSIITKQAIIFAQDYYFKPLASMDTDASTVGAILNDDWGFIWMGTNNGLFRFDGNETKKYVQLKDQEGSLPHNHIYHIKEDQDKRIWILTAMGIVHYNRINNNFDIVKNKEGNKVVAQSYLNTHRNVYVGARNTIYKYDENAHLLELVLKIDELPDFAISSLSQINDTTLLCSGWDHLIELNLNTKQFKIDPFGPYIDIMCSYVDSVGNIWFSPYNKGLFCYNKKGKLMATYNTENSLLSNDIVLCIEEKDSKIWIGTDGGGINIINPSTNKITVLEYNPEDFYSLPDNSILQLYKDNNNNIWAGSVRNGLISIREVAMKTYSAVLPGSTIGLSNRTVLSLYHDNDNTLWIGTDGGGINSYNIDTKKFKHFSHTLKDKIGSIEAYKPGKLLISIFSKGIYEFDIVTGAMKPFVIMNEEINNKLCRKGQIVNILRSSADCILFLTDRIHIYNENSKTFELVRKNNLNSSPRLFPIASIGNDAYMYDQKKIYKLYKEEKAYHLESIFSFDQDTLINSISLDKNRNFWIATNIGICKYNLDTHEYNKISTSLFKNANLVVCDNNNQIWIGADNMLFSWRDIDNKFTNYGESDGVLENNYLPMSGLSDNDGNVFMGGTKGLLMINSKQSYADSKPPTLQLTDLIVNGTSDHERFNQSTTNRISIPWNSNVIVKIIAKEEDIFRRKLYRYKIKGSNAPQFETYDSEYTLPHLSPGDYSVFVSCTQKDGYWTNENEILRLTILPPWHQTWWFMIILCLSILFILFLVFYFTSRHKENKMSKAIRERDKQAYEEKLQFLINISHELRTPLTLIHAPIKRLLNTLSPLDNSYLITKTIYRQSQRMKDLINMVLNVQKMEIGKSKLHIRPYLLNQWISDIAKDFTLDGESKGIAIVHQFDKNIEEVNFDVEKSEIILNNLLINALKHSPNHAKITIKSELIENNSFIRISISDEGNGLEQTDFNHLFTRFYQGAGEKGGSGIGLNYSKVLIELQGGRIGAYNNKDLGATFYFDLPTTLEVSDVTCQPKAYLNEIMGGTIEDIKYQDCITELKSSKVLIVDDNTDLTDFLESEFKNKFDKVYKAANGFEALSLIKSHIPDIIISDVMMPRMDGFELCKTIKEDINISHIPIILLTARDDKQSHIYGYKNGADGYLSKPFEMEMLLEIIHNRLKDRELIRKRYQSIALPSAEETTYSSADESFIIKLNTIIEENLNNTNFDVTFICKEIGMSRGTLYNKLKAIAGMKITDYINKFRMEKALHLMNNPQLNITEIAEAVGFSTLRYFSTVFKQYTGYTPSQWKENAKKNISNTQITGHE